MATAASKYHFSWINRHIFPGSSRRVASVFTAVSVGVDQVLQLLVAVPLTASPVVVILRPSCSRAPIRGTGLPRSIYR